MNSRTGMPNPWPEATHCTLAAELMNGSGTLRRSVGGQPRAAMCGMGVCHDCAVEVGGQRRLACQTLATEAAAAVSSGPFMHAQQSCDVLVIGAGPAGLAAAEAAAASGATVVVVDNNPRPGGQIWRDGPAAQPPNAALRQREALLSLSNVRWCLGHQVVARGPGHSLLLEGAQGSLEIHHQRLVLATGARELLLPFPGWTLPGVTGAGGLQALIKGGLKVAGQRVVIAGSGPLLLAAARTARDAGAQVLCVAEQARFAALAGFAASLWRHPAKAAQAWVLKPAHYRSASHVLEALGEQQVQGVRMSFNGRVQELACERIACGFGLVPNVELAQLLGCAMDARGAVQVDAWQRTSLPQVLAAGECCGIAGGDSARVQGTLAGLAAVHERPQQQRGAAALQRQRHGWQRFSARLARSFALNPAVRQLARPDTLVCRCEDVSHAALAACDSWLDAKLHTRCGMGPCQGRICGAATHELFGWAPPRARHLLAPARIATLAAMGEAPTCGAPSKLDPT